MKRVIVSFILVLALTSYASAHAFLDHAEPRVGSVITAAPSVVKIWFTQALEPAFSLIQVDDAAGTEVDKQDCHLDERDPTLLIVSLPPLASGTYKVIWHVVSTDTHRTQGDFQFTIK